MFFPYGKAPLAILIVMLASGLALGVARLSEVERERPDLIFATFTKEHAEAYRPVIRAFERERGVTVQLQVVDQRALQGRLQAAMQAGSETPDMVELLGGTLGFFTRGPIDSVGFVDLTDRIEAAGLDESVIRSRFAMWADRGHTFALPHDLHPTMLAYRRDLVEELGIDVSELSTWEKFAEVGRRVSRDRDGDDVIDQYMIDLPTNSGDILRMMIAQAGGEVFTEEGEVAFDRGDAAIDVIEWYVKACYGETRISFAAGWGQNLAKALSDGLILFITAPDWRLMQFMMDVPALAGRMDVMPLPAWEEGGRRTSTWGGTGLAFPKQVEERGKMDLAWDLAMRLYFDPEELGPRFASTLILPPIKEAFDEPEIDAPVAYFDGRPVGRAYADLAPDVPPTPSSPYELLASQKILDAFTRAGQYYRDNPDGDLRRVIRQEIDRAAEQVRERMAHNVLYGLDAEETQR